MLTYCPTEDQTADIFTKALNKDQFKSNRMKLGMMNQIDLKSYSSMKFPWWIESVVQVSSLLTINSLSKINIVPIAGIHS